ncbi:hypothetical protein [Vibrio parahaemolyticus]|uniref:hypothetical protein n=1 Tax=Vibrio parahaemolyticus TaxID=670 RepID=UPI001E5BF8E0|nr:hypothetical protein [Vibrio parahaemolyticus]
MKTDSLTPIEQKLASFDVKNMTYIHPSQDAREVLQKRHKETLYGFTILGAEYLMSDLKMHGSVQKELYGSEHIVDLFVNNGNMWLSTSLFLTQWEWTYLVHSFRIVNADRYHAFCLRAGGQVEYYCTERQMHEVIEQWAHSDKPEMVDYMKSAFKPVLMSPEGVWVDDDKPRCPNCFADLTQEGSVSRTYVNKDDDDAIVVVSGQYEGKDECFESNGSVDLSGGRYDCLDDSDCCNACDAQL